MPPRCPRRSTLRSRTREGLLVSVAGGGDTVSALNHAGVTDDFTYVSTAGGAFLEWMEGKPLPGVDVLKSLMSGSQALAMKTVRAAIVMTSTPDATG
jgi:hypothetical protein